jgi:hypothetical protein
MFIFPRKHNGDPVKRDFKLYVKQIGERAISMFFFGITIFAVAVATSFYSVLDLKHAMSALDFESAVAIGTVEVFYTRSFAHTMPVVFQFLSVFPFALGSIMTVLFIIGFFVLPWRREYVIMRIAFLLYFIPSSITYTKWTRFMAPLFPLMILFGVSTLFRIYDTVVNFVKTHPKLKDGYKRASLMADSLFFTVMLALLVIPGLAYLTIYQTPDVRYKASEWIFKNVKSDAYILQETANVVDIPIPSPDMKNIPTTSYQYFSFNFYDVDADSSYQPQLREHVRNADYIFVPSRRIFANHTCVRRDIDACRALRNKYPILNEYYDSLFNGELGFEQVAVFTSYPRIEFFGKTILEFPDEVAEETWTVFDHPVIRIFKRKLTS